MANIKIKDSYYNDLTSQSILSVNPYDELCFDSLISEKKTDSNDELDSKILYTNENVTNEVSVIQGQFRAELKPGRRVVIKEEGIPKETFSHDFRINMQCIRNSGIINNVETQNILSGINFDLRDSNKINEWFIKSNEQLQLYIQKARDMENLIEEKNLEIKSLSNNLEQIKIDCREEIKRKEMQTVMYKYGFISYLVYLVFSLAIFFSFGTMYLIWRLKDFHTLNPATLFMGTLMGIGWSATAIAGLISVKKRSDKV